MSAEAPKDPVTRAVTLLAARERTRHELARALSSRGYAEAEVEAALERVAALGYLDDTRVASQRAQRMLSEGRSRADAVRRLLGQGVDSSLAEEVIRREAEACGQTDEASARALLLSRRLLGPKAARFLASRGFDEALIRRLVGLADE